MKKCEGIFDGWREREEVCYRDIRYLIKVYLAGLNDGSEHFIRSFLKLYNSNKMILVYIMKCAVLLH